MADVWRGGRRPLSIALTLWVSTVMSLVTEEDLLLLSGDRGLPHCFSRNFMKVTCYWGAEELETGRDVTCGFYYSYEEEPEEECDITVQNTSPALYVCEHDDVRLFNYLHVFIKDKSTNQILRNRTIQVEMIGIFPYPGNIRFSWDERIRVNWDPPEFEFPFVLQYEACYWPEDSTDEQRKIVLGEELTLSDLTPHLRYKLRLRTSWVGESATWGPWSEVITFDSPGYSDIGGVKCVSSDLTLVCCQWKEKKENHLLSPQQVFYRYREAEWRSCKPEVITGCDCAFLARNDSAVSLKIQASPGNGKWNLYYPKPFWIYDVVLLPVPVLQVERLPGNTLALKWSSPLLQLEEHLMYQIRFSQDGEKTWTILQIPAGARNKTLSAVEGTSYVLQLRAALRVQGLWGDWSARITIKIPSSTGWIILAVGLCLLSILAAVLCMCCKFPFLYRKLKNKLWPPVPNLHRVLDTFLAEIQKQYQPGSTWYEKSPEDVAHTSCVEILSEVTLSSEGQPLSRDYVQLSPPTYQNEDNWPKLELLDLHLELNAKNQPPSDLINQTYLPTSWSF